MAARSNARTGLGAAIIGTGHYLPRRRLTNQELITRYRLDTSDEWIVSKTGIRERRIAAADESTTTLAVRAAQQALKSAGITGDQLGAILVSTSSPDTIQPPTACLVQAALNARRAFAYDLGAVCSGFVYSLVTALGLMAVQPGLDYVLVVSAETYSRILDYTDRTTCIFFGDGAGAVVLARSSRPSILSFYLAADGTRSPLIGCPSDGPGAMPHLEEMDVTRRCFRMDGKRVWDFVVAVVPQLVEEVLRRAALGCDAVDLVIPHQANEVLLRHAFSATGIPLARVFINLSHYGNTASASVPIALSEAVAQHLIKPGDRVLLLAFGGGLTWGGLLLEWQEPTP